MTKEHQIEESLIAKLADLKYTYRPDIRDRDTLELNFRKKFEALNRVNLTDSEFNRLRDEVVNPDVFTASKNLRDRNTFQREDGTPLQYTLVNIKDWCKNEFEVVNQLRINTNNSHHRYDVILLINGVPVVQIELKSLDISPRRAMQQIVDYKNVPGNGYNNTLLCFIQLFIVSNRANTYYFANNQNQHFSFNADEQFLPIYQLASEDNKKITHLDAFAEKFLAKCTLGEMISRYMVLIATEQKLLVMRPYQIYAVKAIVDCIHENRGNGYIWHTTGSGKTLTSFKAATLLKDNPDIEKCIFVVDRKDLDRQTRQEFNKFQEGCVEENTNTETLVRRMLSDDYADKVIVTTIQKLGIALDPTYKKNFKERLQSLSNKRVVFIFDECHRSQFGENHQAIKEFFPNAQLFGFTGTPIFEENATYQMIEGQQASYITTKDIFQQLLHAYTITHAIEDRNVLRFHIDYFKGEGKTKPKPGEAIAQQAVVEAILDKHDAATHSRRFNAVLATSSINSAIEYFNLFKGIQAQRQSEEDTFQPLNIACVFSPPAEGNKDVQQIQEDLPQEKAVAALNIFMHESDLACEPEEVYNLKGDAARIEYINRFKEVQRLKTQLDQYTDLSKVQKEKIEILLPEEQLRSFRSSYLETAKRLKAKQDKGGNGAPPDVQQLDFEFVLFASAVIDYDYIMGLIANYTQNTKQKMTREQLINLLSSSANLMEERDDIAEYINSLQAGKSLNENEIRQGYQAFKDEKSDRELAATAEKHGIETAALQSFVDGIMSRMIFDGELLSELLAPLGLGWKARTLKELALMEDLVPQIKKLAQGREISGLAAYE